MAADLASLVALHAAISFRNEKVATTLAAFRPPSFTEQQLLLMVRAKNCEVPGVSYGKRKQGRWIVQFWRQGKRTFTTFPICTFTSQGMTKLQGSLAALRAAIALRAKEVGLAPIRREMLILRILPSSQVNENERTLCDLHARSWSRNHQHCNLQTKPVDAKLTRSQESMGKKVTTIH